MMVQLFAPEIDEEIACIERELGYRRRVYPRRVAARQMTQANADREIERMEAVLARLKRIKDGWLDAVPDLGIDP